jgi:TPR repeat protein
LKDIDEAIDLAESAYYKGDIACATRVLYPIFTPSPNSKYADDDKALEWAYRGRLIPQATFLVEMRHKRDPDRSFGSAVKAFYRSAVYEAWCSPSPYSLGIEVYNFGHFYCPDRDSSVRSVLYRRAAMLGSTSGMWAYARDLPDRDPKKLKYLRMAAEAQKNASSSAQWELGLIYEKGLERNPELAQEWKTKALANGYVQPLPLQPIVEVVRP